jgi:uncharacterized protein (DUF2236 family)
MSLRLPPVKVAASGMPVSPVGGDGGDQAPRPQSALGAYDRIEVFPRRSAMATGNRRRLGATAVPLDRRAGEQALGTRTPPIPSSANPPRPSRPPCDRPARTRLLAGPLPTGIAGDPGWFGPGSQVWQIWRERLLLLGGPAAVLLQLAHPLIAAAVAAHSSFRDDPLRRLRAVLHTTLTVVFGDRQQATAAAARVGELHRRVQGRLPVASGCFPAGSRYRASDPQLALWVHATLVMVALDVVDQFVNPLGIEQRADYYQQSKPFARLFGVTEQLLPDDYEGFQAYLRRMLQGPELAVDQTAQDLAAAVLDGWLRGLPHPPGATTKLLTAGLLPARLQEGYGLAWGRPQQHHYAALRALVCSAVPSLSPSVRFWPHYLVALRRVAATPDCWGAAGAGRAAMS